MNAGAMISDADRSANAAEWPRLSWIGITALIANSFAGAIGFLGVSIVAPLIAKHFAGTPAPPRFCWITFI